MKTLIALYRRLFPKHIWTYSECGQYRACSLTGAVEELWEPEGKTPWGSSWQPLYD